MYDPKNTILNRKESILDRTKQNNKVAYSLDSQSLNKIIMAMLCFIYFETFIWSNVAYRTDYNR